MDPNPYESPKTPPPHAPARLPAHHPTMDELATAKYVLAVLRDMHRQQCQCDPEADPDASLSFASTVAEWRAACDLLGWQELGRAYNQLWSINVPDSEWQSALEPAHKKRLEDVCALIARYVRRPEVRPTYLFGCTSSSASAFLAIRSLLHGAGANANEIAPSTPLAPYTRQYCQLFLVEISRLAPGALPLVRIHTPIHDAAVRDMVCGIMAGMLCLTVGVFSGLHLITIAGALLFLASYSLYSLTWIAAGRMLPESVEFGELRTFRDLAVVVAEGRANEAGWVPK